MTRPDPVEAAFALLRTELAAPEPDAALEAQLRARFRSRPARRIRPLPFILAGTLLSGAAFAASGGVDWVKSWWYAVEVEGASVSGVVIDDGERIIPFETAEGDVGSVRMRRDRLEDGTLRTRIDIDRSAPGRVEHEESEDVFGARAPERFPISVLDHAAPLYSGACGELFGLSDGAGGSRLLVLDESGADRLPVAEIARFPFDVLATGSQAEFTERPDGGLAIAFDDGRGGALEFVWQGVSDGARGVSELETPDGKVRVRVENADDSR